MKPEQKSKLLLGATRSQAKINEFGVDYKVKFTTNPDNLFYITIGILGDVAAKINTTTIDRKLFSEQSEHLQFSAHFFDAYLQTKLNEKFDSYLLLLGSSSYYLCDLPGSSRVLVNRLGNKIDNLEGNGLENLLFWLLNDDISNPPYVKEKPFGEMINDITTKMNYFYKSGIGHEELFKTIEQLRKNIYVTGSPRHLLLIDIIYAITRKRYLNSTWFCLPFYSGLDIKIWQEILKKETFIKEFWPAQHILGEQGIFKGKSAVVQMPTSAGKTKAMEIMLRSAFLTERTLLVIIVAPFKALCHEIKSDLIKAFNNEAINIDELSDVLQLDFQLTDFLQRKQVIIVTPEKLVYVIRHSPEIAPHIGLLIFDEGHQFDNNTRGITYELLLTSLNSMIPDNIQKVLISAVIKNAGDIGKWLNGEESAVITGTNILPIQRSIAFTSLLSNRGKPLEIGWLRFLNPNDSEDYSYFVPKIIKSYNLIKRKEPFPTRKANDHGKELSLYLGLKLSATGSVAIFCGRKDTASGLCETALKTYKKELRIKPPSDFSDISEIQKLHYLYIRNFGETAIATECAAKGIFSHHGNTPHGIRLAVEYAMKEGHARLVICTSTLAQGVNLPIRYLVVTSVYQGRELIKIRDFHNLIGRVGRAGMHTEGSIIFADNRIYDNRKNREGHRQWEEAKKLLEPGNSEPCVSTLFSLFEPFYSDDNKTKLKLKMLDFVKKYIENYKEIIVFPERIAKKYAIKRFSKNGIAKQIEFKLNIITAVESFLMAHWDESETGLTENNIESLAKGTLAYFLAKEEQQQQIVNLFKLLAKNIKKKVSEPERRKVFGKILYGVRSSIYIEKWVLKNCTKLQNCSTKHELLRMIWPVLLVNIQNNSFKKCDKPDILIEICLNWTDGLAFHLLLDILINADAKLIWGEKRRQYKIEHLIDICENGFGFHGSLVIGAIIEISNSLLGNIDENVINNLLELQKAMRYGLSSKTSVFLYEMGFGDRIVTQEIAQIIGEKDSKSEIIHNLQIKEDKISNLLEKYPKYFKVLYNRFVD